MQCNMMRLSCWVNNQIQILLSSTLRRRRLQASLSVVAGESIMATNSVRVAAAQMTSITDLASNFSTCSRLVKEAASAGAKLVCFPEAFSFVGAKDGDSVSIAQPLDGPIMDQYCSLARESSIWLSLGGFQEKGSDPQHLFNTHVVVDDTGKIQTTYRKIHLFDVDVPGGRVYKESNFTESGKDIVAVDSPIGRLGLSVCYDLISIFSLFFPFSSSMATETLDDTKPKQVENEAKDEPKPEEEVEVTEQDAEIAESDEKKEIDEHEDSEKDDDDEDGDEDDADADDEEEEDAGEKKGVKKEASSEKKSPVTPTSDRPTRERKTVERYSEPSPSKFGRSSSSKGLIIEKGRGTQLKDIPNVAFKLSKRKPDDNLHMLHSILFGKKTKVNNLKRNIGQFSGYVWAENEEKQRTRVKERIDKCVKEKLIVFCDVLNIPINKSSVKKEELSAKLLEFLESPHATTDVLLAEKEQKGKKRVRKATSSKSPGETPAKKKKQTSESGKKRKPSDVEEDDQAELSDAKDESQDEDVAVANNGSDNEVGKSEGEEDTPKAHKSTSKKSVKEGSVAKAEAKSTSVKKTSAKAAKSSEKTPKKSIPKKSITEQDSASLSKSDQPATKIQKTGKEKQDTKGKAASKTAKAAVKDQGKGKSSKKTKVEPSRQDMHAVVVEILKEVDFNKATLCDILRQLGKHFGLDLMHRKAEVKDIITDVINNMSDEEDEGEEEADSDGDGDVDAGKDDAGKDGDASDEDEE